MKKLIYYFIDRSLIVNLISVLVLLFGTISIFNLQKEIFPSVEFDVVLVTTIYPGSTPEDVEKLVTIPIERKLKSVVGIDEVNALSLEGSSIVYLQVDPESDIDDVLKDVKNELDAIDDLPDDAKPPQIKSLNNKTRGVIKVAVSLSNPKSIDYDYLRKTSKRLRDKIEESKDIAFISLDGYLSDEIRVEVNPDKLLFYDLTMSEIARSLQERNLNLSSGKIKGDEGELFIRTVSEFQDLDDIRAVVVRSNDSGKSVLIKDLAIVTRSTPEDAIVWRSQGKRAIFLDVKIKENSDILDSVEFIKNTTNEFFKKNNNSQVEYRYVDDASYYVKRRLNILKDNGLIGIVLVFFCLLAFLNFRTSVVTSLGAPIAFMISFIVMTYFGISINLISMFALILVLGMLVDDSIIVSEQFYQKLEAGVEPKQAAREAAIETIQPVTATILTTIIAFGSLFFMGGIMGKFLWAVPVVVIICLIASFFECFFILPSHLADFCKIKNINKGKVHWYSKLVVRYKKFLSKILDFPFIVSASFFALLITSVFVAKKMRFELFPGDDVRIVFYQVKGKVGTPIEKTDAVVKSLEKLTLKELGKNELDQIAARVGMLIEDGRSKTGSHYGSITIYLTPPDVRDRSTDELIESLKKKSQNLVGDYEILVTKRQGGPPKGKPVDIELKGNNLDEVLEVAAIVQAELAKIDGVLTTEIDFEKGTDQVVTQLDEAEVKRLGLSTRQIALELRRALSGDSITEIREDDEDIEIKILLDKIARKDIGSLNKLEVLNNTGRRVPLKNIITYEKKPGAFVIRRLDGKRIVSVSGALDKSKTNPLKIVEILKPVLTDRLKKYEDVNFSFAGENKDTQDSMKELFKSFAIAVICIFCILVLMFGSLFQPIIVMSAIPLGLIGVIVAFKAFGLALGFMALMGVVGLVGVVVNDSIVLVNFINIKLQETSLSVKEAVLEASASRFRPVILTTVTTVAGLLPVAHAPGGDPFLKPMAYSFAYGLLFASLVTLIFIPSTYLLLENIKRSIKKRFSRNEIIVPVDAREVGPGHN